MCTENQQKNQRLQEPVLPTEVDSKIEDHISIELERHISGIYPIPNLIDIKIYTHTVEINKYKKIKLKNKKKINN